ncbi:hypothetical protein PAMC26510_06165 [Caballeronia sordidicola]|uniref:Uncharacterized protein n=1 Tax=Caballeronia sordidicola TaxID=196367 RepID=A0A242N7Q6_CABSO|nr:hypothetical protein PAMC26510_06165 [Caballeronia sordidicola]
MTTPLFASVHVIVLSDFPYMATPPCTVVSIMAFETTVNGLSAGLSA